MVLWGEAGDGTRPSSSSHLDPIQVPDAAPLSAIVAPAGLLLPAAAFLAAHLAAASGLLHRLLRPV